MSEMWGIARFKFHEGKLEEFKRLSAQAMEIVRTKDTGTLQYDIYFNDDQSECVVLERYRDSEAAIEHASNLGDLFGAVLATITVVHGELLGEPSAELSAKLAESDVPVLFTPYLRCRHRSVSAFKLLTAELLGGDPLGELGRLGALSHPPRFETLELVGRGQLPAEAR